MVATLRWPTAYPYNWRCLVLGHCWDKPPETQPWITRVCARCDLKVGGEGWS